MASSFVHPEHLTLVPGTDLAGAPSAATIHVLETAVEFDALREDWERIFDADGFSVFQSFEWQRAWWKHYGEGNPNTRLAIVLVRVGGRLAAIAPFFIETLRVFGVLPIRRMGLIGRGQSDYLDFLVVKGMESLSIDAIAGHCASRGGDMDLVGIEDFSDRSPQNLPWYEALQRHGFHVEREITDHCPRMAFKATWEETLSSIPCNNSRKMEKFRRQLATRFNGALEFAGEEASFQEDLDCFIRLHQQRWKRSGWPGLFEDERYERFFREALDRQHRHGNLILAFYRLEGERRLGIVGFRHRDEFLYYLSGLGDPGKTTHFSPGLVLHILCMEALFHQGIHVYDFLRGTEPYKTDLGGVLVPSWTISAVLPGRESALRNFRWLLLQNSFRRRIRLEWSLFHLTRKEYGLFSAGMKKHASRRWKSVWGDGLTKAKNPEKTVAQAAGRKA